MINFWHELNKPILALAPMAGITDSAFRQICRINGADVTYSEMASVSALYFKPEKTLELLNCTDSERPYIVQLFGKYPEHFAAATKIVTEKIKPDGIDINFGCPAKKVFGHGSGCALMPQKELARAIISSVCDNTNLPVSIKIRAGIKDMSAQVFLDNTRDLSYSAVMIHGRTYEGSFSGLVDWDLVAAIKQRTPEKIIIGNGGLNTPEEAVEILKKYPSIDGLGIARGAWGAPFIFQQIKQLAISGSYDSLSFEETKKILIKHAELLYQDKGQKGIYEIRKHLSWYVRGFPGASELRRQLVRSNSLEEIKRILFDQEHL